MSRTQSLFVLFGLLLHGLWLSENLVAQVWDETLNGGGDAPGLTPGQITVGSGPLLRIDGTLANADFDPDMYCISITNPGSFSATTAGSTAVDLSLWLFDANGLGVAHDGADDFVSGPNSGYQATLTNQFVVAPGIYFLAVTRGGIDAESSGGEIWADLPTVERSPDGPGAAGAISSWSQPGYGFADPYSVRLTGASYHVPEPMGASLLASGVLGLACLSRRRRNS